MLTTDKPSELINQAISNAQILPNSQKLVLALWECMKEASKIEIREQLAPNKTNDN